MALFLRQRWFRTDLMPAEDAAGLRQNGGSGDHVSRGGHLDSAMCSFGARDGVPCVRGLHMHCLYAGSNDPRYSYGRQRAWNQLWQLVPASRSPATLHRFDHCENYWIRTVDMESV